MKDDIVVLDWLKIRRAAFAAGQADTSKSAALTANATERPTLLVQQALEFVRAAGPHGATLDEWLAVTGLAQSHSGRFTTLKGAGLIIDSGKRRQTRAGRMATVYVAAEVAGA